MTCTYFNCLCQQCRRQAEMPPCSLGTSTGLVVDAISTMAIPKEPTENPGWVGEGLEPQPEKQKSTGLVPKTPQKRCRSG